MDTPTAILQHLQKLSGQLESDEAFFDCLPRGQGNCSSKRILRFLEEDAHLLFKRAFCFEVKDRMQIWAKSYGVDCKTLCLVRRIKNSPYAVLFEILITTAQSMNDLFPKKSYYVCLNTFHLEKTVGSLENYRSLAKQPGLIEFENCFAEKYEEMLYPEWLKKISSLLPHRAKWKENQRGIRQLKEMEKNILWQIQQDFSTFRNEMG